MSFLEYFRAAFELAKNAQSVELQRELLEMQEEYNTLRDQNIALKERVKELEASQALATDLTYRDSAYYLRGGPGEDGPFCQRCWDVDKRLVRVQIGSGSLRYCAQCQLESTRRRD